MDRGGNRRHPRACPRLIATAVLASIAIAGAGAAELQDRTRAAYDAYVARARQAFLDRLPADAGPWPRDPSQRATLLAGGITAGPGAEDGIIRVPGGLVHHWVGAMFEPSATLDEVLDLSRAYERYPDIYGSVVRARVLERSRDEYRLLVRLEEHASMVNAVLDVTSRVRYVHPDPDQAYSFTDSIEIREVQRAGRPDERLLPEGRDRGYLWRANAFAAYVARDGGVYMELETIGLSRGFPPLLGWIIEPFARRLGRKSTEGSLREFRTALAHDRQARRGDAAAAPRALPGL